LSKIANENSQKTGLAHRVVVVAALFTLRYAGISTDLMIDLNDSGMTSTKKLIFWIEIANCKKLTTIQITYYYDNHIGGGLLEVRLIMESMLIGICSDNIEIEI
jgi:hypothetical protein